MERNDMNYRTFNFFGFFMFTRHTALGSRWACS